MKKNLFVYGSLMFPEVRHRLVSVRHTLLSATLADYQRYQLIRETYPGLIPQQGQQVQGRLILGLTLKELVALDRFEGKFYQRIAVEVVDDADTSHAAEVYLFRRQYRHKLSEHVWDAEAFAKQHLQTFINTYQS